jgi:hypothetical protein
VSTIRALVGGARHRGSTAGRHRGGGGFDDCRVGTFTKPATGSGTAATTAPKHRATTNNPVSSALKKLSKEVTKATAAPKHAKPSAE